MSTAFPGQWKQGDWIVPIPSRMRKGIESIRVESGTGKLLHVEPSAFYVVIPGSVRRADKWQVTIENGVLNVGPPRLEADANVVFNNYGNARIGMQVSVMHGDLVIGAGASPRVYVTPITIGFVLPRDIPIH